MQLNSNQQIGRIVTPNHVHPQSIFDPNANPTTPNRVLAVYPQQVSPITTGNRANEILAMRENSNRTIVHSAVNFQSQNQSYLPQTLSQQQFVIGTSIPRYSNSSGNTGMVSAIHNSVTPNGIPIPSTPQQRQNVIRSVTPPHVGINRQIQQQVTPSSQSSSIRHLGLPAPNNPMNYINSNSRRQVTPPPNKEGNSLLQKTANLQDENVGLQSTIQNIKSQSNVVKVLNKEQSDQYANSLNFSNQQMKGQISGIEEKLQSLRKEIKTPIEKINSRRAELVEINRSNTPNAYDSNIRIINANSITPQHHVKDLNQINSSSLDEQSPFNFSNQNELRLKPSTINDQQVKKKSDEFQMVYETAADSQKVLELTKENQKLKERLRTSEVSAQNVNFIEEITKLKARIAELESQDIHNPNLQEMGNILPTQNQNILKDLRRLNEDNNSLYDDNKQLLRENKGLKRKIEELLEHSQQELTSENEKLKLQLKRQEDEHQQILKQFQQKADSSHLLNMISDKDVKITELEESLRFASQKLQNSNFGLQNAQSEVEALNRDQKIRLQAQEKDIVQKNSALEQIKAEYEKLSAKNSADQARISDLEGKLGQAVKNVQSSVAQIEEYSLSNNRFKQQLINLGNENNALNEAFQNSKVQIQQMTDQILELRSIIEELKAQNSQLEMNSKELYDQNSMLENHHHQLIERENLISSLKKEIQILSQKNGNLQADLRIVGQELESEKVLLDQQNQKVFELKQANLELGKDKRQLEFAKQDLLIQLSENAQNNSLALENERLNKELQKKQAKLEVLENGLVQVKQDVEKIMHENEIFKQKNNALESDRQNLSDQLDNLEQELLHVEQTKADLTNELLQTQNDLKKVRELCLEKEVGIEKEGMSRKEAVIQIEKLEAQIQRLESQNRDSSDQYLKKLKTIETDHEKKVRNLLENFEGKMIEIAESNDLLQAESAKSKLTAKELEQKLLQALNQLSENGAKRTEMLSSEQELKISKSDLDARNAVILEFKKRVNILLSEQLNFKLIIEKLEAKIIDYQQSAEIMSSQLQQMQKNQDLAQSSLSVKVKQNFLLPAEESSPQIDELKSRCNLMLQENSLLRLKLQEAASTGVSTNKNEDLRLVAKVKELESVCEELKSRINRIMEENSQLNQVVKNSASITGSDLKSLDKEIKTLLAQNANLRQELTRVTVLEQDVQKKSMMIDGLNRELAIKETLNSKLLSDLQLKDQEILQVQNMRILDENEKKQMRDKISSQLSLISELEVQKSKLVRESIGLEDLAQHGQMGNSINDRMMERLKQENLELIERINMSRKENLELKDQILKLERKLSASAEELSAKSHRLRELEIAKDNFNTKDRELQDMSVRAQETEHLKLQLDHNKDELNRLTEKAQKLERKNFDLENKLESVQGGKGSFGLHRDSSKSISSPQVILLETQIIELRQEKNMLKSKVNILVQENESLQDLSTKRLQELESIKIEMLTKGEQQSDELVRLRSQFEAYIKQHYDIQELSSRHQIEIRKNQEKISELLQTITGLQEKIKDLQYSIRQKNEYITALESNNDQKVKSHSKLSYDIDSLRRKNIDLNHKLSSVQVSTFAIAIMPSQSGQQKRTRFSSKLEFKTLARHHPDSQPKKYPIQP